MAKNQIRNYIFIDEALLDDFIDQIDLVPIVRPSASKKVSLSITGPSVEINQTAMERAHKVHEKIELLENFLSQNKMISYSRLEEMPEDRVDAQTPLFFIETMVARKVIFPRNLLLEFDSLTNLCVWVSDPNEELYVNQPWVWRGTFLYLTQGHWDSGKLKSFWSGCSALQVIVNKIEGFPLFSRSSNEIYGRHNADHPVDKLKSLGAFVGEERKISSFYMMRYPTNEQCYTVNGEIRRVNDLLAYPIYISEP